MERSTGGKSLEPFLAGAGGSKRETARLYDLLDETSEDRARRGPVNWIAANYGVQTSEYGCTTAGKIGTAARPSLPLR